MPRRSESNAVPADSNGPVRVFPYDSVEIDGSVLGKPGSYSPATGYARPDVTGVGEQMLRGEHSSERSRRSIRQRGED